MSRRKSPTNYGIKYEIYETAFKIGGMIQHEAKEVYYKSITRFYSYEPKVYVRHGFRADSVRLQGDAKMFSYMFHNWHSDISGINLYRAFYINYDSKNGYTWGVDEQLMEQDYATVSARTVLHDVMSGYRYKPYHMKWDLGSVYHRITMGRHSAVVNGATLYEVFDNLQNDTLGKVASKYFVDDAVNRLKKKFF